MAIEELDAVDPLEKVSVGRQALRRVVNERIGAAGSGSDLLDIFCECGRVRCAVRVTVGAAIYDRLLQLPGQFLVTREHVATNDRVVAEHGAVAVVEKAG